MGHEKKETVGSETGAYANTMAAKELDANMDYYIKLVAKGTRKTKEEITRRKNGAK